MADSTSDRSEAPAVRDRVRSIAAPILAVSGRRFDQAFMLLLLLVVGWQLVAARQFSADGRLFVVVIGVPTFLMTALLLLSQLSERVGGLFERLGGDLLTVGEEVGDVLGGADDVDEATARLRVLRISTWIVLATLLVVLIGFIPSILLFMVVFYLLETDLGPARSVGYAAAIWLGILVVFVELLNTRFYGGLFDLMSLFPYP